MDSGRSIRVASVPIPALELAYEFEFDGREREGISDWMTDKSVMTACSESSVVG